MKTRVLAFMFGSIFVLASFGARAEEIQDIKTFLQQNLGNITQELDRSSRHGPYYDDFSFADPWTLKAFELRLQAMVGFKLPFIASVELVPQIELVFQSYEN